MTGESLEDRVRHAFEERFHAAPRWVVRAPGRVNLIGEHTDYNGGFVLPLAIDRAVWIAARPRSDRQVVLHALDLPENLTIALDRLERASGWGEYLKGVAWALQERGDILQGWEGVLAGDVPQGAGLSSSAALELAAARTFAAVADLPWDAQAMALLGQKAENDWVGVRCGIMDPLICATAKVGHASLIDCRSLATEPLPLPPETVVVVLDTTTRRGLVDSAYNERRSQCEAAARFFGVPALRDVSLERFAAEGDRLDETTRKRARHVITENTRTLQAAEALRRGDAGALGDLMNASHVSLRDDFAVSRWELDAMVECGRRDGTCLGIRMTGAGFGGCVVALVMSFGVTHFLTAISRDYHSETRLTPIAYVCTATNGADVV